MSKLNLDRATLAQLLQGNARAIAAFEQVLGDVGFALPSTIEEANALAGQALAAAQAALAMAAMLAEALARIEHAPALPPQVEADDHAPRTHLGTISGQNADQVEITGGTVDSTAIGATTAAIGKFTTLAASGQITSTIADGTAPLVVTSATKVPNLYVDRAALADTATTATTATSATSAGTANSLTNPTALPAAATDLPTVIALANALRGAAQSKGL